MSRLEDIRYCVETEVENDTMPFARQRTMAHRRYLLGLVDRLKLALLLTEPYCRNLHHEPEDYHDGPDCPVEKKIRELLAEVIGDSGW